MITLQVTCGLLLANTPITWEKAEGSNMNLTGKSRVRIEGGDPVTSDTDIMCRPRPRGSRSSTRTGTSARWASAVWTLNSMLYSGGYVLK